MKGALAAVGALSMVLASGAQAATPPPIRVVSRPFSLAHGDPLTITVYDRPPQLRNICTSVALPNHTKGGGCWRAIAGSARRRRVPRTALRQS